MRRAILLLVACLSLSLPSAALAEDWVSHNIRAEDPLPQHDDDDDRDFDRHHNLDELFEDVERVPMPPIGIIPGHHPDPNSFPLPSDSELQLNPAEAQFHVFQLGTDNMAKIQLDPNNTDPVQIKNLVLTKATPADEFIQNAVGWGVGLVSAAFGLLALASLNSLRLRKKTKKQ